MDLKDLLPPSLYSAAVTPLKLKRDYSGAYHEYSCERTQVELKRVRLTEALAVSSKSYHNECCQLPAKELTPDMARLVEDFLSLEEDVRNGVILDARVTADFRRKFEYFKRNCVLPPTELEAGSLQLAAKGLELAETQEERFKVWSSSTQALGYLDLRATLSLTNVNTYDLSMYRDVRDIPSSLNEYIERRRTRLPRCSDTFFAELKELDETRARPDGFLLVSRKTPALSESGFSSARILLNMRVSEEFLKIPRNLAPLFRFKSAAGKTAVLRETDEGHVIETAETLFLESAMSLAEALKIARNLERS